MSEKKGNGCVVAAIVGVVVGLLLIVGLLVGGVGLFRAKRVHVEQMQRDVMREMHDVEAVHAELVAEQNQNQLTVSEDDLPKYELYAQGDPLSLDWFVASRLDRGATMLAAETFRENIDGIEVTWRLQADNLFKNGAGVAGDFSVPYIFRFNGGRTAERSSLKIRCEFTEGSQDKLLEIRRGDWIWIQGKLSVDRASVKLNGARQVPAPVEEE